MPELHAVEPADGGASDPAAALLTLYDGALPEVYGYLRSRCGNVALAEDLTSETFLAAVDAVQRGTLATPTVAWLIAVARHKLVDHWRRAGREERKLAVAAEVQRDVDDPWEAIEDVAAVRAQLARLGAHHRSALTLRYLDGLSVPEVAALLERTVHATEALLVRARIALRNLYAEGRDSDL